MARSRLRREDFSALTWERYDLLREVLARMEPHCSRPTAGACLALGQMLGLHPIMALEAGDWAHHEFARETFVDLRELDVWLNREASMALARLLSYRVEAMSGLSATTDMS